MGRRQAPVSAADSSATEPSDTPLSDALLDQFAAFYVVAVIAVTALEEARRQRLAKELASDS